ncbi:MAG: universal stress protein [Rhodospirillales bacterium]|nr:universal stress protein [Rhodospirillales bacterium]
MGLYRHVMAAVDQTDDAAALAARGLAIAQRHGARLTLMHVVDQRALTSGGEVDVPLFGLGAGGKNAAATGGGSQTEPQPVPFSTDDRLIVQAEQFLQEIAGHLGEAEVGISVAASGSIPRQIVRTAHELSVDLLVCGAHHRHGLALFMPSAIDGIIHHLPCDVLLLRLS